MSLITRCPACETLFKVVPDQLRISEGWVRCGQCDEIFDASYHLLPEVPDEDAPETPREALAVDFESPDSTDAKPQPLAIDFGLDQLDKKPDDIPEEWSQVAEHVSEAQMPLVSVLPQTAAELSPAPALPLNATSAMPEPVASLDVNVAPELSEVSFLRSKKPVRFKDNPRRRVVLFVLGFLLCLGLWVQVVVHERDRIVAWAPTLQPVLQALCTPLKCALSPLRRPDLIVVESASFTKLIGNTYQLNFTVKNTAATALAVPAVELTLTDSRDQPVVRRVFLVAEMGVKLPEMAAGAEWVASLPLEVNMVATLDALAGYRVLAFYP